MPAGRRFLALFTVSVLSLAEVGIGQTLARSSQPPAGSPEIRAPQGGTCGPTQITESASQSIIGGNSVACSDSGGSGFTYENHYWRAFDLAALGIPGSFTVCQVEVAVEFAIAIDSSQPLTVNLYSTPSGSFPGGALTSIGTAGVVVPDQDTSLLTVPITGTAPAGSALVVEVVSPDGTQGGWAFFIGSNNLGQTAPSYLSATACGHPTPVDLATLGFPGMHIVLNVRGTGPLGVIPPPPPECAASTTLFANTTPTPIPDVSTVASTIDVSGMGSYLWDLNLLTGITHASNADLVVTLKSPAGTTVTITSNNGGSNANVFDGTVWDDGAGDSNPPGPVTLATFTDGVTETPLVPEGAMGAFIGEDPNGTWTLTVTDTAAGNTGSLNNWSLELTSLSGLPNSSETETGEASPLPIPDNGTPAISAVSFPAAFSALCGARAVTHVAHPHSGDLVMTLTSPSGTVVTLSSRNGGSNADVFDNTEWTDGALTPVTDYVFADGVAAPFLQPEEAMSAFLGENPTGLWTLTVTDQSPGSAGSLDAWELYLKSCTCNTAVPSIPVRVDEHINSTTSNLNGVFEVGETVQVETAWRNPGTTPFTLQGSAQNFTGPPGPTYTISGPLAVYGPVAPLQTVNCYDYAPGSCFVLSISGARPLQHWDAVFDESVSLAAAPVPDLAVPSKTWTLHVGESFPDVPTGQQFYKFIENLFHNGVTGGCGAGNYCPGSSVTRAQMAVFLLKAEHGSSYVPPACAGLFGDVVCPSLFADWIERLAAEGITGGCGGGNFCPDNAVRRDQMAAFLLKAEHGSSYVPPACAGIFPDVACPSLFADWIERLSAEGITGGCGGGNYCPSNPNTRGQMAVFLVKTFGLLLYGP